MMQPRDSRARQSTADKHTALEKQCNVLLTLVETECLTTRNKVIMCLQVPLKSLVPSDPSGHQVGWDQQQSCCWKWCVWNQAAWTESPDFWVT